MGFREIQFPTSISHGSSFGPGFATGITEKRSGDEQRVINWERPKRRYDARWGVKTKAQLAQVLDFIMVCDGAGHGFRWKDWSDFTTASDHTSAHFYTDIELGVGDGIRTTFQLLTKYTVSGYTRTRPITKPVDMQVRVAIDGVEKNVTDLLTAPVHGSVNYTTGVVTFLAAPAVGEIVTGGCTFDVPARFGSEIDKWMRGVFDAANVRSIPSIPVVEEPDPSPTDDEFHFGGAKSFDPFNIVIALALLDGRAISLNPTGGSASVTLPNATLLPGGLDHFGLWNMSGTTPVTIKNVGGSTLVTLAAGAACTAHVFVDASNVKYWVLV